jgi:hypothetical protein
MKLGVIGDCVKIPVEDVVVDALSPLDFNTTPSLALVRLSLSLLFPQKIDSIFDVAFCCGNRPILGGLSIWSFAVLEDFVLL